MSLTTDTLLSIYLSFFCLLFFFLDLLCEGARLLLLFIFLSIARNGHVKRSKIEERTQPITLKSLGGYVTDHTGDMEPLYEYLTITSIILHPDGLAMIGPAAFDTSDNQATVVFEDGSKTVLTGMGGSPYCDEPMSQLKAELTMDISKADYVLLPDGTKLTVPKNS